MIGNLNNLICHQNNQKKSNIIVLPHLGVNFYVHFKDEINLKNAKVLESKDNNCGQISLLKPQLSFKPVFPFQTMPPHYSQELLFQRMNPIMQSQDRYLLEPRKTNYHFQAIDNFFVFQGLSDECESINSKEQENDKKISDHQFLIKKSKKIFKVFDTKNTTKNTTKNFSKAIISYITFNQDLGLKLLGDDQFKDFMQTLKEKKK